ncbi:hypothetical protein [Hymenobacter actinosclerus]|uniref:hypothetical protein n=1 Tax=Hymenobacter actinosclerus TaxID=82805 RepID=UPI000B8732F2|nr:hypothetical protein [Hymenobacter actinosclerus]
MKIGAPLRDIASSFASFRRAATDEVLDYLGEAGFDPQFGARPLWARTATAGAWAS